MMSRGTDGEAMLPLPAMRSTVIVLEIHLAGSTTYVMDAVPAGGIERRTRGEGRACDRHRGGEQPPGAEDRADRRLIGAMQG